MGSEVRYEELDKFLEEPYKGKARRESIEGLYRLSGLQQGMLFHSLYDRDNDSYIEQLSCELINPDLEIISKSWNHLLKLHSILRSGFYYDAFRVPVQCVYSEAEMPVTILDFRDMNSELKSVVVEDYEKSDRRKGFDLKSAPLMRIGFIRMSDERYRMLWTSHHLLFDGWSMQILMEEFLSIYEQLSSGKELITKEEDKFEDYIKYLDRIDKFNQENYWREYMKSVERSTLLPFIRKTQLRTKGSGNYETVNLNFNETVTAKLEEYSQKNHITINTLMQGVWSYLLHRYTGNDDVVYGIVVSGRPEDLPGIEQRVGMYVNTIPLHAVFSKDMEAAQWLRDLQDSQVTTRQYQYVSLQEIQKWSEVQGDLFDSILVFENYPVSDIVKSKNWNLKVENVKLEEQSNYPFLVLVNKSDRISVGFNYKPELMSEKYVRDISSHFGNVLHQLISNEFLKFGEIKILSGSEEYRLLEEFNKTDKDYPEDKTVFELFEEQVIRTPESSALVFDDERLTYRELNEQSNRLAHFLQSKGVKAEMLVPLFIERSKEMIIGILGILKAGGAYVPVDPEYPEERIKYILEDTEAMLILSSKESRSKLPALKGVEIIEVNTESVNISSQSSGNLKNSALPVNLIYVIYTSGTTGRPKGVKIEHRGAVNLATSQIKYLGIQSGMNVLQFSSIGFDASCWEIYTTLLSGANLIIPRKEDLLSIESMAALIRNQNIDVATLPSSYQLMIKESLKNIRTMISAGEPLNAALATELQTAGVRVFNAYGPTENSVCVTNTDNPVLQDGSVTIGKPIANVKVYILDKDLNAVPEGASGELCVGGVQLARGYLNLPELTDSKFIKNPFSKNDEDRIYKTGDLARWLPDGNIEYLGRIDDQIKIAGHRIETGEIESLMKEHSLIEDAAVVYNGVPENGKLVGFYKPGKISADLDTVMLRSYLGKNLPDYMIPAEFVILDEIPLTSSGKVDRKNS
ncbi:MAG: amino acid adenylation domain-containing protein [Ignavibacteria bacterium]|nr:amino acid adenylation domain-containing protein [Ignavibacteria bacterium]